MSLIHVEHASKKFIIGGNEAIALKDVSLTVETGEFIAIVGQSGSGKSTLLSILGFLDRPTSGVYRFEDRSIQELSDDELAKIRNQSIGFVFQSFNLLPRTSVFENIARPLLYSRRVKPSLRKSIVEKSAENVGIAHRLSHTAEELSGGEKQRVAIARALVNNPRMILADEPTGNLDSKSGGIVMDLFARLHSEGRTIVLITHESYTARYASKIITLKDGLVEKEERQAREALLGEFQK